MKKSYLRNLFFAFTALTTLLSMSCSSDDTTAAKLPATCTEVQEQAVDETGERPENGTYTLYVENDETKPWDAYCNNMKRAEPTTYLTVTEADNFSQFSGNVITETSFRRYRIDPTSFKIDLLDDAFATTTGESADVPDDRENIPAGWAQFGNSAVFGIDTARSRIDLTGTNFAFADSVTSDYFCTVDQGGDSSASTISIAADLKKVNLSATNTIPSIGATKTVADCSHLSIDDQMGAEDFTEGTLKLQYMQ